jgi:hypothetical protein
MVQAGLGHLKLGILRHHDGDSGMRYCHLEKIGFEIAAHLKDTQDLADAA